VAGGQVITFYSYKGGTGRSMALANVAWILALNGKRVLTIDWDLEAPGLHRYFLPFLDDPELAETSGLIDLFWSYTNLVLTSREEWPPGIKDPLVFANAQRYAVPLEFPFPDSSACIHFLGAGQQDEAYANRIRSFDWHAFYERLGGAEFVEALGQRSRQQYDYVLIDSRTGVADTSGICTVQMPDAVVLCFTYNRQSLKGVEAVARSIKAQGGGRIRLLPVAMRADRAVKGYEQARLVARELLEPLLDSQLDRESLERYWGACEVPYYSDYALEENLSILNDLPGQRNTLLNDMVWLAETISGGKKGTMSVPELDASVRERYRRRFALRDPRLSQLTELMELPPADAYSRLSNLIASSADEMDNREWMLALAKSFDSLTDKLRSQGLSEQAVAASRDGIGILKRLHAEDQEARRLLAGALSKLAVQLEAIGRSQEALAIVDEAIQDYRTLALEFPELTSNLANALSKHGTLSATMGQLPEALHTISQAVKEYEKLAEKDGETFEPDLAGCLINQGQWYNALGNTKEALEATLRASSIYERLATKNPETFEPDRARSLRFLADCYQQLKRPTEALKAALQAAVIYESQAAKDPKFFEPALAMGITGKDGKYYELNAPGAQLEMLPEDVCKLPHLRHLDLSHNKLTTLPDSLLHLRHLHHLDISGNKLTQLPEVIFKLSQLQHLNVSANKLTLIPEVAIQLQQLQSLNLSNNGLWFTPPFIEQLTQLRTLDLSNNSLAFLSESLGNLTKLRSLEVSGNKLASLPESLGRMTQLQALYLADNQLTELPEFIARLTQLRELNLSSNSLTKLPESLLQLAKLKGLYLHENEILGLPAEVLGPAWGKSDVITARPAEILEYYFRTWGGERRPLNEAKLILLGRGGVGKTSIVNQLIYKTFKGEKKTEGIRITEWSLRLNGDEDVLLNVWDFGGQEIMHATHQFFLTQRSLYLLVLNGNAGAEDAEAEYWLKLIESFGDESPVIVVLNKIKEHPFDLNRRGLQQKYPFIRYFVKTDCADATGLEELRKTIERETDALEHLRDAFPASWFSIKDQLPKMQKNYLSFDQYRDLCIKLGEKDPASQELLAGYLHRLGIALNYKDDARLQDTHVLNPRWLTDGIYKILNSDKLEQQQGEIRLNDLPDILDREEYPQGMHRFLFDLMRKFDLCFIFPDEDTRYLMPDLLDKQEPENTAEFEPEECLNFQYHYPVLPEGLLPRFIVRTHTLSENLPRWRTGVILTFEGNRALVKADVQDKKVFISVSGTASGRRRLLAIIRSEFERIHRDIRNLQPQEMVPVPGRPNSVVAYKKLLVMEQGGVAKFPEVIGNDVINLSVQELLDGVDLEGTRRKQRMKMSEQTQAARLFYSYSHRDEGLRNELETHLTLLQRQGLIESWHDRDIEAGDEWKRKIDDNLERADIILLLVSADFIASDYCYEKEIARALERHENGEARVIPVILRDANWRTAPFAKLQALPKDGLAVTKWADKDSAWRNVSEGIEKVASHLRHHHSKLNN
jgi:internalin A